MIVERFAPSAAQNAPRSWMAAAHLMESVTKRSDSDTFRRKRVGPLTDGTAGSPGHYGQEARKRMPKELLRESARRVAAVSVAVIVVIAALIGVAIWRYEQALSRSAVTLDARSDARLTGLLVATFWHERQAMDEYLFAPSPAVLERGQRTAEQFAATSATLGATQTPIETRFRLQATAADNGLCRCSSRVRAAAGTTASREVGAAARLSATDGSVLGPLAQLYRAQAQRADSAQAASASAGSQALVIGVTAAAWRSCVSLPSRSSSSGCCVVPPSGRRS